MKQRVQDPNQVSQGTSTAMEVREATNPEETVPRRSQLGQVFNKRKAATT